MGGARQRVRDGFADSIASAERSAVDSRTLASTDTLAELGRQLRIESIRMADTAGSGHPTSSMSAADLIAVLIARHLRIDPQMPSAPGSDRLVFSKGHASPLLYSALAAIGVVADEDLAGYRTVGSPLEGHPVPMVPGVDVATGSLGVGLPMGVGMAMVGHLLDGDEAQVWVLCGDSELAEGSMWEAIDHAGWLRLPNLTAIVDVNRLGQTGPTRYGWDVDAYARRFQAHGWRATTIDGHDIAAIDTALADARTADQPTAVIARTIKGSGATETADVEGKHGKALEDPQRAIAELGGDHQVTFQPPHPEPFSARPGDHRRVELPSWDLGDDVATRIAFGAALLALGRARPDVVALDGEVANSTGLEPFAEGLPERFFQMFIAEQLMMSVAIGMQALDRRPFAATFAAFVSRAHDVLRMAAVSRADLCVTGSHAGVSIGEDGPSQMGLEDLAMMRALNGSTVLYPCDANQTAALVNALAHQPGVSYLRTTRGATPVIYPPGTEFPIGGSVVVRESPDDGITIVGAGVTVHEALTAADALAEDGISARVVDAYSVKPIDDTTLAAATRNTDGIVIVEDHRPEGGLGEAVLAALSAHDVHGQVRHLAIRTMPGSATPEQQRAAAGIDAAAIAAAARELAGPRSKMEPG
jgi:transketolase